MTSNDNSDHQDLVGYRTNEEWQDLVAQAAAMITALDEIEDETIKVTVFGAMNNVDAIHREALHRLVRLFKEGVLEQVITDPAINTLMGMYDLLPPEQPACQKIWDFVPDANSPIEDTPPQSTELSANKPAHWSPAPIDKIPDEGGAFICHMDEGSVMIANIDGNNLALEAICPTHNKIMTKGKRDGVSWICPHGDGCSYDLRNGSKLGGGVGLMCFPTKIDAQGRLLIGFGIPFEPIMPSF